jgi:hypothetical protein
MRELGFLPSPNMLYLQVHLNGPPQRHGPNYISWAFIFCLEQTIRRRQNVTSKGICIR